MVSAVVKVLEMTTTRVSSGSRSYSVRRTSTGSTFDRNRSRYPSASSRPAYSWVLNACSGGGGGMDVFVWRGNMAVI